MVTRSQIRIQQMAFMIVAVLFFFVLVGLFFVVYQSKNIKGSFEELQKEQALSSLKVVADMPELNCDDSKEFCIDRDKAEIMVKKSKTYAEIWPVASIKLIVISNSGLNLTKCHGQNCNFYDIYESGQKNVKEYSTFVSFCSKNSKDSYIYDKCEIGKLLLGVKLANED